ncbi:hypothetical protein LCGC14_0404750 [marine sediment metagenome]|uniref:Heparan-alpha-glucosaminide N-acetyltransferase catalytic domain-containing protein n=1 Tax=marine sediment metagenome TaxID=412755 RepID=A0A0F9SVR0_9ZZZZ
MPNSNTNEVKNSYLNNEDLMDLNSPKRIASIDFVKGLAMVFIILAHGALAWLDNDWRYIYGLTFAFLDFLGPSLFVFLSALSVVFSIRRKKKAKSTKAIRNGILTRGIVIIIIGIMFNPMSLRTSGQAVAFPLNLWGWNILMFIGFSQILSYYSLKLSKRARAVVGVVIIFISPFIRDLIFTYKNVNVVVWVLDLVITSPLPQVPLLPYLSICFLSTIFGELLFEAMVAGTDKAYKNLYKTFKRWGVFLIALGLIWWIFEGFVTRVWLQTESTMLKSEYLHLDLLRIANMQDYYKFPGMPTFMIRATISNMFYSLGAGLLIIAICFNNFDIKKKNNDVIKMVNFYGKTSLSLFLIQYMFLPLYIGQFSIIFYPFIFAGYCAFLGLMMYIWLKYFNGVGSPEWIMAQIGKTGQKRKISVQKDTSQITEKTSPKQLNQI